MIDDTAIKLRYSALDPVLDERGRRRFAAAEALAAGRGGVVAVARITGIARSTIGRGLAELRGEAEPEAAPGRVRRNGAGRPALVDADPTLLGDLAALVEPTTRGDPMAPLRWTAKSLRNLAAELGGLGHRISHNVVADLLRDLGYSLQANRSGRIEARTGLRMMPTSPRSPLYPDLLKTRKNFLAFHGLADSDERTIRGHFLSAEDRSKLIALARDGSAASRVTRRANALVLLDDGWSAQEVADALLFNDDTIRGWFKLFEQRGIEGLTSFDMGGSASFLSAAQEDALKVFVSRTLPRSTRHVGAFIEQEFGLVYESRSGLIALLHRLGLEYHQPNVIPRKLDEAKQKAFIESYEKLLNSLGDNEAVLFADAVHPTHAARPVGCWAPKQEKLAIEQTSGRQRINIHGAIDLATGQTRMIEALTIDAASTIRLLQSIEALYPMLALIHVFLDNASYHHAKLVQEWLARAGCRIELHFIPSYCPHLNPIERLWGLMHRNVTHNKCYATCAQFADATLGFLREKVPRNWADLCDSVTDNFRVINPKDFRVMT